MTTDVLTLDLTESLDIVDEWLSFYVAQPHEQIGRPGAVCPFVAPARRVNAIKTVVRLVGPAAGLPLLAEVIRCSLDEFEQADWSATNPSLRSLLVVLPDLPRGAYPLFDEAHALVKSESVERGLMIGQFHPECPEPAARNPSFLVSRSPVPLVAVRAMAIHDIFFLAERAEWFDEYRRRFGGRHRRQAKNIDPVLTAHYRKALALHQRSDDPDPSRAGNPTAVSEPTA
ncbi:DUF6875 domain-containing protein [Micromonospora sp. WMMD723]|uniref:DUF6875 domain-containing protein n=1 Tax=Micromonospora sp. WMMD723 TaxID=3403465 RepID=UPI003CEDCF8C